MLSESTEVNTHNLYQKSIDKSNFISCYIQIVHNVYDITPIKKFDDTMYHITSQNKYYLNIDFHYNKITIELANYINTGQLESLVQTHHPVHEWQY